MPETPPEIVSKQDLLRWAETIAGIARTGLGFTEVLYEQERYEEILKVAADMKQRAEGDGLVSDELYESWRDSVIEGTPGYVTPKVTVGAVVGNDDGEILLIQRADSGRWLYPTGWADVGYSASEVVVQEVAEETGIDPIHWSVKMLGFSVRSHCLKEQFLLNVGHPTHSRRFEAKTWK